MTIEKFTYEIVSVNEFSRSMEIMFSADGFPDVRVGGRMPTEGESLDSAVIPYAPIHVWEESVRKVAPVAIGEKGVITILKPPTQELPDGVQPTISGVADLPK